MQVSDAMVCCKTLIVPPLINPCDNLDCSECSVSLFQFNPPVPLVMSLLLMETVRRRGGWRCAEVGCGEQFMTQVDGTSLMHKSHVDNWDTLQSVSYSLYM